MDALTKEVCSRCDKDIMIANYSWFTDEIVCHACIQIEGDLIESGEKEMEEYENVGEIPEEFADKDINWGEYDSDNVTNQKQ
jgi:hypothetical protein